MEKRLMFSSLFFVVFLFLRCSSAQNQTVDVHNEESAPPATRIKEVAGCEFDEDCPVNQKCPNKVCVCKEQFVNITGDCKPVARYVNDSCEANEQCSLPLGGYSECRANRCICITGSVPYNNTQCLVQRGLSGKCEQSVQCSSVEHAYCSGDICACEPGYVTNESICLPVVNEYEGDCSLTIQCHRGKLGPGSDCRNSKCQCEYDYFFKNDEGKCLKKGSYSEECGGDRGCYLDDDGDNQNIVCRNNKCQCNEKSVISEDRKRCVPSSASQLLNNISFPGVLIIFLIFYSY